MPLQLAGLMLAFVGLGRINSESSLPIISDYAKPVFGSIAAILFIMLVVSMVANKNLIKQQLKASYTYGVLLIFLQAITIWLGHYAYPIIGNIAFYGWCLLFTIWLLAVAYFIKNHLLKAKLNMFVPTWLWLTISLQAFAMNARKMAHPTLGVSLFYIGLVCFALLLPLIIYTIINGTHFKLEGVKKFAITILFAGASNAMASFGTNLKT